MNSRIVLPASSLVLMLPVVLGGCQGIQWGGESPTPIELTPTSTPTPFPGGVTPTPGGDVGDLSVLSLSADSTYFALDAKTRVSPENPETSTQWDIHFEGKLLFLNGGESGPGSAWGLGPVGYGSTDYEALTDHSDVVGPVQYYDEFQSVLSDWYEYIVSGQTHGVYSRYHVYAIQVDPSSLYKIQLLDYYDVINGSPESAIITFRWATLDSSAPSEFSVDARAGGSHAEPDDPANKYTYFSFATGNTVELTDAESVTSDAWDIAFKRYYIKLNGGVSGPKGVVGFDYQADRVESTSDVTSYTPESELPLFEQATVSGIDGPWVEDRIGSIIQGSYATDPSGQLVPSEAVYVVTDAAGKKFFKFMVTALELDSKGSPVSVTFRSAEID